MNEGRSGTELATAVGRGKSWGMLGTKSMEERFKDVGHFADVRSFESGSRECCSEEVHRGREELGDDCEHERISRQVNDIARIGLLAAALLNESPVGVVEQRGLKEEFGLSRVRSEL